MLKGKNAVVTGGSRGLGRALAHALAAAGCNVALVGRSEAPLQAAVRELRATGAQAHAIVADVADKHAVHAIAGQAAALLGGVDILIQNASTLGPVPLRSLLDTQCEDFEAVLQTNLIGPFRLAKVVAGNMLLRGGGLVVHISSDAALVPYAGWGAYGVSKAALDHLTRIWAAELEGSGVHWLSIDPGEMDTEMHAAAMPEADRSALASAEQVAARIIARLGTPGGLGPLNGARIAVQESA